MIEDIDRSGLPSCLLVGGTHAAGDGYPNARYTLRLLENKLGIACLECGVWLEENTPLWRMAGASPPRLFWQAARLAWLNLLSLVRVLRHVTRTKSWVYIPYPAIFFLWWLSWFPRFIRPKIIADAYISLWDSWVRDRSLGKPIISTVIKRIEARALRTADHVLVDTRANERFYADNFGLDHAKVHSFPLAIDEDRFLSLPEKTSQDIMSPITVLFVGTMIPLHGVDIILQAVAKMQERADVRYRLVGDGQQGEDVARFLATSRRGDVSWVRDWQSLDDLAREVAEADICLGIFGGTPKSSRVMPFKVYMYLAAGKPVISQENYSAPDDTPSPPLLTVPARDPDALAAAIRTLSSDAALRRRLGSEGRIYFSNHLGSASLLTHWKTLLNVRD